MMLMGVRVHDSEIRFDDVVQCREQRHLNSVQQMESAPLLKDKDERNNNLLFTKGCGCA